MHVTVVEKGQILLVGFSFFGDPFSASSGWTEENEIGRLWQRLMTCLAAHGEQIKHIVDEHVSYELHLMHEQTQATSHYDVFAGVEIECHGAHFRGLDDPDAAVALFVPVV